MRTKLIAILIAATAPTMASAESGKVGGYCDTAIERLTETGYGDLRVVDPAKRLLAGSDPAGRPVLLVLHPRNGHLQALHHARFTGR